MAAIHDWGSSTTHAIEYILHSREDRHRIPASPQPLPCRLLEAFTGDGVILFAATCFACSGFRLHDHYFQFCEWQFISGLRSRFPAVPGCCAKQIGDNFRQIVECAHATHRCPRLPHHRVTFATTHLVRISVRAAIEESFQEAARLRPAAKDSERELFKARDDDKEGDRCESRAASA